MSFAVRFRPAALAEFNRSADWYEARQVGLGQSFVAAVDASIDTISSAPTRPRYVYKEIRLMSVKGFPYQIYYRVLGSDVVEVLSIFHVRQNPSIWQTRD
ncbi:MAG: type II toxin-antitoxin system RelE/ParE family toxin [Granulosicoccus sp.]